MTSETAALPKGLSHAVQPTALTEALREAGILLDVHLIRGPHGPVFECFFWPPNARNPMERLYIRAGAVKSADAQQAREYVQQVVLPEFVTWVKGLLALPANAPRRCVEQHFERSTQR